MEKSSKNLISLFREMPARATQAIPHPTASRIRGITVTRGKSTDAGRGREIQTRKWDAENGGRGTTPLVNGLTFRRRIQNKDSQYLSSPYCVDKKCLYFFGVAGKQKSRPI
jgi:hypothetical protein